MPEAGDLDKPKLVFFFDEAHLLFNDAPQALMEKIEQVVRLIRSKGVGVYFVSQNPLDIPDILLGQLGNRVQHALRAFTPRDQKAVKAAADTFRVNAKVDVATAITELGVGEALVSFLDEKGRPNIVERAFVAPPGSRLGPVTPEERAATMKDSLVAGVYEKAVDRESAYEKLSGRVAGGAAPTAAGASAPTNASNSGNATTGGAQQPAQDGGGVMGGLKNILFGTTGPRGGQHDGLVQSAARSAVRTMGTQVGKEILRGVLGGIFGRKR